ncbi:acetate/propionate family kinase [Pseudomonas cannabina]|uniref:Acetate kinase n=1 Tax=Pseudomonas cannabina TaxID=86840 RepID=A0A0P9L8Q3_PSECA|nr:propionate kinase [Pseudomonas cannabina]KAA8708673.1 propionate kinase [Pseudomonas cannabina]KPW66251.1 Acetate kinase [Pseudomonas cannabina]RMN41145.1 Acetate kinase [Pseudomonas cannabina]SDR21781.1 acetate kinase [Pseudomonas cannabina]
MTDQSQPVLLVLNTGSSSIKFSLYNAAALTASGPQCLGNGSFEVRKDTERLIFQSTDSLAQKCEEWLRNDASPDRASPDSGTLANLMDWIERYTGGQICAAAHRVVHGGSRTHVAERVDAALIADMQALVPLAPLHQPLCLAPMTYLSREHGGLVQFACFDTAFHHTLDALETRFGLPAALTAQGVRRYGFHGLSYEYIASVLPHYDQRAAQGRTIVAHLGNGASLCAMHNRVSRGTTMGFSTLDGVLMGTRPGRLDPGVLLYLLRECGMSVQALEHLLYHECGLLGVSGGISSDMRELSASQAPEARDAIALFVRSVVREIGSLAAILGGIDALVFTGGIGEHACEVRDAIIDGCAWLGLTRDRVTPPRSAARLSRPDSAVSAWTIATDENAIIARHALGLLHDRT